MKCWLECVQLIRSGNELRSQAWWVLPSLPGDWFSTDPSELWYRVLGRQGGSWAMWAHAAEDPEVN